MGIFFIYLSGVPYNFCITVIVPFSVPSARRRASAFYVYGLRRRPAFECSHSQICHTGGDSYACKTVAVAERIDPDIRHAGGNGYACKARTVGNRIISDLRNAVGDSYAFEFVTAIERAVSDPCYTLFYDD